MAVKMDGMLLITGTLLEEVPGNVSHRKRISDWVRSVHSFIGCKSNAKRRELSEYRSQLIAATVFVKRDSVRFSLTDMSSN